jgi:hypothetical protein
VRGPAAVTPDEITGDFVVFDANDGKVLYRHNLGRPIVGGIAWRSPWCKQAGTIF